MKITQQLALMPPAVIFSLAFTAHGIPYEESLKDAPALFGRGDTADYCVYPKDTQKEDQATAIYTLLKGLVPDPKKNIQFHHRPWDPALVLGCLVDCCQCRESKGEFKCKDGNFIPVQ